MFSRRLQKVEEPVWLQRALEQQSRVEISSNIKLSHWHIKVRQCIFTPGSQQSTVNSRALRCDAEEEGAQCTVKQMIL